MPGGSRHRWWDIPVTVLVAAVVVLGVTRFVAQPFAIPSGSMEPTLQVGDRVIADRLAYRADPVRRGDVIVFDGTGSLSPAQGSPSDFVKRVIGIAGDRVACCDTDGRLTVNGRPLEERYLMPGDAPSEDAFDVVVPQGMLWVMGDHRSASADSRAHLGDPGGGMVPETRVIGRASFIAWPPSRWGSVASAGTVGNGA